MTINLIVCANFYYALDRITYDTTCKTIEMHHCCIAFPVLDREPALPRISIKTTGQTMIMESSVKL